MTETAELQFAHFGARRIAYRHVGGDDPALVWLGGFRSDMEGTKAERMEAFARSRGAASLRFDYSGHGQSSGDYREGGILDWRADAEAIIAHVLGDRPVILVGSSMGGWIGLLLARALAGSGRLNGLCLLAPAPDFTVELMEPRLSAEQRRALEEPGRFEIPSQYSPEPNVYTKTLFDQGREARVLTGLIETRCPVHILHGMADPDVPHDLSLKLLDHLPMDSVTLTLIKDGDHRLSRDEDLMMLEKALDGLLARARGAQA